MTNTSNDTLRDVFGFSSFREHQEGIVDAILAGRDAFAVMPTGDGGGPSVAVAPLPMFGEDRGGVRR